MFRSTHLEQPILRLDVVGPEGRSSEYRVFCRYEQRSVAVGVCCACLHCDEIAPTEPPTVHCTVTLDPTETAPDPMGARTAVGSLLEEGMVVLGADTSVGDALGLLRVTNRRSLPVVGENHHQIGVVHEAVFAGTPGHRPNAARAVGTVMSASLSIHEKVPVRKAVELLAAAHLREATIVDDAGVPLGVFRDVEGIRWLVRARPPTRT